MRLAAGEETEFTSPMVDAPEGEPERGDEPAAAAEIDAVSVDDRRHRLERTGLRRADLDADPFVQFERWFADAVDSGLHQPEAMALATTDADGTPSARLVLLRGRDHRGFAFFTNYESRKAGALDGSGRASLVFPWHAISRQVRVEGSVVRVGDEESDAYFAGRPRGSRLGAWASPQSQVVADRAALDALVAAEQERWGDGPIERPPFWGGYRVRPDAFEFWQGRADRLHDRFRYRRPDDAPTGWVIERLAP